MNRTEIKEESRRPWRTQRQGITQGSARGSDAASRLHSRLHSQGWLTWACLLASQCQCSLCQGVLAKGRT